MQRQDGPNQLQPLRIQQVLHTLPTMPPHRCAYLPGQVARDRGFALTRLDSEVWEYLLESGWRRAGGMIYEPVCPFCRECTPLRIPVKDFAPNRTQRRTLKHNIDLTARMSPQKMNDERADLYRRYIRARHNGMMSGSRREFEQFLGMSPVDTFEIEIRQWSEHRGTQTGWAFEDSPLMAVMVLDRCPRAWNAVYCYFDPDEPKRSLGTFAILQAIEMCLEHCPAGDNSHLYLGYWVPGSKTMNYKAQFHPHEIRTRHGKWERVE